MSLASFAALFFFVSFLKRYMEITKDTAPLHAEIRALRAENARWQSSLDRWNATHSSAEKAKMTAHRQQYAVKGCWGTLGIQPTMDKPTIMKAFRKQAKKAHPDHGGNAYAFQKLFEAKNEALRYGKT